MIFFFQAEDGIRDAQESRGLGDVYKRQVLQYRPEALLVPVYLTEAGPGDGRAPFTCEQITRDVIQYTRQLEYDPYVRGFHLWNVGPGEWLDASDCVPMIRDALLAYYAGRGSSGSP